MTTETRLFHDAPCFVFNEPEAAGFYELELPESYRWLKSNATCRYRIDAEAAFVEPYLLVRAASRQQQGGVHLTVSVEGRVVGVQLIPSYGAYFFSLPKDLLRGRLKGDCLDIQLSIPHMTETSPTADSRELALTLYELRIIDLDADEFPERQYFREQIKSFGPNGGGTIEILENHPFDSNDRILDVGAGGGWTTLLLAEFCGGEAWGIDLYDYAHPGRMSFKAELLERLDRHRPVFRETRRFASLAERRGIEQSLERCSFVSMSAEDLLFRDNSFDFVFSLNAFEHISRPDLALAEIRRVLRPGGRALLQFSPLYYSDAGSHLPGCLGFNRPWAQLVMTREEIKVAITDAGGVTNEIDGILDSLNGWKPAQFIETFEKSGFRILSRTINTGFICPEAEGSPEFIELLKRIPREDLTTIGMLWYLEKPDGSGRKD